jgi:hypothetical protein
MVTPCATAVASHGSDESLASERPGYLQGTSPGSYRFTPGVDFAFTAGWGNVTPFVRRRSSQFRPDPPFDVRTRTRKY